MNDMDLDNNGADTDFLQLLSVTSSLSLPALTTEKIAAYDSTFDDANTGWTEANVWVIARPLDLPDYISFISRGRLPFCHWGVLISPRDRWGLEHQWFGMEQTEPGSRHSLLGTWGNLYELWRDPLTNKNIPNVTTDFGPSNVVEEWTYAVIHYVGKTLAKSTEISQACPFEPPKKADVQQRKSLRSILIMMVIPTTVKISHNIS